MGSFGERMRREREKRKITLEDISEASKISIRSLQALERGEFDKLPGGIFNKGFVRAYARQIGLDEDQVVAEFVAAAGTQELPLPDPVMPRSAQVPRIREKPQWKGGIIRVLVLVLLVVVAWKVSPSARRRVSTMWAAYSDRKARSQVETTPPAAGPPASEPPTSSAVSGAEEKKSVARSKTAQAAEIRPSSTASVAAAAPVSRATAPAPDAAPPKATVVPAKAAGKPANTESTPREFVVRVRALRDARVQIVADGQVMQDGLLVASATRKVRAKLEVIVKTENAAAVEVSFNGKALPPLGGENQVATVTFNNGGLRR